MATEISPQYNPKDVEEKIYKLWEESGFFNPDHLPVAKELRTKNLELRKNKSKLSSKSLRSKFSDAKTFCIAVPPPNVTGSLHMGHALNAVIQDILIRKKRMEGFKTLWLPGTDHAGIATQNVVEKELRKEGKSRHELGREKFLEKVWEWKEKYGNTILAQFKKLGSSMDWSCTRFTMDGGYKKAVEDAFIHYYEKGWIYRGERTVNWCSRCSTSLSDLEIEYREEKGKFYYIKYGPLVLGTARPETKLGDTALAVNPADKRYKQYVGQEITIKSVDPTVLREQKPELKEINIKVVADQAADPKFGTGVIKVTPAHDATDFEIYQRHPEIPVLQVIGENGRMTKEAGIRYEGFKVAEARKQIIEDLEKLGLMDHIEDYTHNVALCYRCGTVIEPLLSKQWFLKMEKLAEMAIRAVKSGKVKFHPKRWEKIYFNWLGHVKDWCISRQIWWGHRLPVYFCENKQEEILNSKFQISKNENENFIVSTTGPKQCPFCKNCEMEQSADVLDTWFSSALWPFAALGWPASVKTTAGKPPKTNDLKNFYPTSVLSTARDIINLWVARMVFSGLEFMGKVPFKDVIIHATILTKDGKRMSKSLGTGIDPMTLIEKYGADATRFGLMWQAMGNQDIHWSEEHIIAGRKFCNKIWNASRFVLMQISNLSLPTSHFRSQTVADKKILAELKKTKKEVSKRIEKYEFGQALHTLYDFFWHEFCDQYIEASKTQVDNANNSTPVILLHVLSESLKLLHPFMPFITEEIWGHLPKDKSKKIKDKKNIIMIVGWPK